MAVTNLVSIIVPVYRVEEYLERCVRSLREQVYSNIEIILVDDGSPDRCPEMCDAFAQVDSRVKVIHQENKGLSEARNTGLRVATGKYVAFVDSDDWVSPHYIEYLLDVMGRTGADIVECDALRTDGTKPVNAAETACEAVCYTPEQALQLLIEDRILHQTVWNKLYQRAVIEGIEFAAGRYNEDEFWTYQIFGRSKRIAKIDCELYYYYQNSGSIMGQGFKLKHLDGIEAKIQRQHYIETQYPALCAIASTSLIGSMIYAGQMSLLYLDQEDREKAIVYLEGAVNDIFGSRQCRFAAPLKHRLWFRFAQISFVNTCKLRNYLHMNV